MMVKRSLYVLLGLVSLGLVAQAGSYKKKFNKCPSADLAEAQARESIREIRKGP